MSSRCFGYTVCALGLLTFYSTADCAGAVVDKASAIAWVKQNKETVVRDENHPDRPVVELDI